MLTPSSLKAASVLAAVMRAGHVDVASKIGPLLAKEPELQGLFGSVASG